MKKVARGSTINGFQNYSPMLNGGRALVLPTIWGNSYDRPGTDFEPRVPGAQAPEVYSRAVVNMVKDIVRTVDFLNEEYPRQNTDPEQQLDMDKLIFVSCDCLQSECMIVADKLVSGQNRFAAAFFGLGGIYNQFQPPEVDQLTYLPHLDTPTVILNKKGSLKRPQKYSQEGMLDLLPLPQNRKKLYSIPKQKWGIPVAHIDEQVNAWFDQLDTLGPPPTRDNAE